MKTNACGVDAGCKRNLKLAAGADINREARFGCPARNGSAQERLARVVHASRGAVAFGRAGECGVGLGRAATYLGFVKHHQRGAELLGEGDGGCPTHRQHTVVAALGGTGPHLGRDVVCVGR